MEAYRRRDLQARLLRVTTGGNLGDDLPLDEGPHRGPQHLVLGREDRVRPPPRGHGAALWRGARGRGGRPRAIPTRPARRGAPPQGRAVIGLALGAVAAARAQATAPDHAA